MALKNIFTIPVSQKRQTSMKRSFIVFSCILFLLIFTVSSIAFVILMEQILHQNSGYELMKTVELERLRLEASVNAEIAIVLKMADSPIIVKYFDNPYDSELKDLAFDELNSYCRALVGKSIFWVNDKDNIFYSTLHEQYTIDPDSPENYWYNMTLYETDLYNLNINYNPDLNVTNLWINAPVFNIENIPVGIVGTGINLSDFINDIYIHYTGNAQLYFFNLAGEITGARDINLVKNKVNIKDRHGLIGEEIFSQSLKLKDEEIIYFDTIDEKGIAVLGTISALDWYVTAVHSFYIGEALNTRMTILFGVMIIVILSVFTIFNIFVAKLLEPLNQIIKSIGQISSDWDLKWYNEAKNKNEIETLGKFLNMTVIDQLTGLYNRRFFDGSMKKIIKSLSRTGGKLSLLMLDIDFFKKFNDTYGHDMGDNCLRKVAAIISRNITRDDDFAARYGGEEFVVVLPNTDENGALLIAEKLLNSISECNIPHENSDTAKYVTVSIGGTTGIVKHSHEESDYVKRADAALYKSKNNGRNQYTFECFDPC
ncbi:MAG: sensor domain-containing diguanylate cyclase [Treponema sp.]|nr:sensor domain-containing diguanylate cyclase [Treponema sp.]